MEQRPDDQLGRLLGTGAHRPGLGVGAVPPLGAHLLLERAHTARGQEVHQEHPLVGRLERAGSASSLPPGRVTRSESRHGSPCASSAADTSSTLP
ncbi:MAG: hypothetical protein JWM62_3157 [Frankiales bacterium]|nr:hypothetical protein [Frankiales bacterium]